MGDRRAGSIVAAVTLTISAAFVAVILLFIHAGLDVAVRYAQNTTDICMSALFAEFNQSNGSDEELARIMQGFTSQQDVDTVLFRPDGSVRISTMEGIPKESDVFEQLPAVRSLKTQLGSNTGDSLQLWDGLEGLFPHDQVLYEIRYYRNAGAYLLLVNNADEIFTAMRQQISTLVLALSVVMVILLLLVMFIVRWYRKRLIKVATTDELTGLANRKSFARSYEGRQRDEELADSTIALIDVDLFKTINDSYGHAAGDHVLAAVAAELRTMVGERGLAGRWGGDEFIAIVRQPVNEAANRIKETIGRIAALEVDGSIRVSVSVGAAHIDPTQTLQAMVEQADDALYVTKEGGRGFLTMYVPGVTPHMAYRCAGSTATPLSPVASAPGTEADQQAVATQGREESLAVRSHRILQTIVSSLLDAVHHMVPFVAGGGILIAIAFLIDGASVDLNTLSAESRAQFGSITPIAAGLRDVGSAAFNFMLPIFAAFFARGLGGEEAFMAGFAGGFLASQGSAGFLGAICAAVVAAIVVQLMRGFISETHTPIQHVAPVLLYPIFSLLIMFLLMRFIIDPLASAFDHWLTSLLIMLEPGNRTLLGAVCGAMMATDMGGPINKAAYHFGVEAITSGSPDIMAAVMVGGMVPPCGIALCMALFRSRFASEEHDQIASTLFMGLSFITEGAIPFAIADIARVIPSCMLGSAVAGALSELFGCTLMAPHGGIFVFPVVGNAPLYATALAVGSLVTALVLGALKSQARQSSQEES